MPKELTYRGKYSKVWDENNRERRREIGRNYYYRNRDKELKRRKEQKIRRREFIDDFKLVMGCSICGYNRCAQSLDFHHPDPTKKELAIADAVGTNVPMLKLIDEADNCVILCRNCHAELHAGRLF